MKTRKESLSTGLPGLDKALKGIIAGDNIVWQVEAIADYVPFVSAYRRYVGDKGKTLIYFRFAKHKPLVDDGPDVEVHHVDPNAGFESFLHEIHTVVKKVGYGGFYLFDCLSDLAVDWFSDRMLGNFFMLTCPYLYDLRTIAYFALLKDHHSFHALKPIMSTTQLFLNVYNSKDKVYVHPIKIQQRYSPTIHMLHVWRDDDFFPVSRSATISTILASKPWSKLESHGEQLGPWISSFLHAKEVLKGLATGEYTANEGQEVFKRLLRMAITRNDKLLLITEKYLTLSDVINIRQRMIGTGLIGGKSVGFLLARAILAKSSNRWADLLEEHDSFFVGSDVFYTFLVENGCWWVHQKQKDPGTFLENAEEGRQRMLVGSFPDNILEQFNDMLDYFGQSPIIVRSSSLQEDNFRNSFVGKYESVFCPNQGPRQKRLSDFLSAVKTVYASTMSEQALRYRARRGVLDMDEQMALLVQRVSGDQYGRFFYPQMAGVGLSFNPYVWSEYIDPHAGMLRLVFGLGTRAVDRADDDYTRVVALNAPNRRPEANYGKVKQYSQRKADIIDLEANRLDSINFTDIAAHSPGLPLHVFCSTEDRAETAVASATLTFNKLFSDSPFISDMREMLSTLQDAYEYPVDIEFTANFFDDEEYRINLLQCRPLQVKEGGPITDPPKNIPEDDIVLEANGAVIGYSKVSMIDRFIYVVPEVYGRLPVGDRYSVAHLIGRINRSMEEDSQENVMLLGPGRWGTASPELGVPVKFAQISRISSLCEIVEMRDDLIPDVSLGTHFFNELVEADILYLALFPDRDDSFLNRKFLEGSPNKLPEILPDDEKWSNVVRVVVPGDFMKKATIKLHANTLKQTVVCYKSTLSS